MTKYEKCRIFVKYQKTKAMKIIEKLYAYAKASHIYNLQTEGMGGRTVETQRIKNAAALDAAKEMAEVVGITPAEIDKTLNDAFNEAWGIVKKTPIE